MTIQNIFERLKTEFNDIIISLNEEPNFEPSILINPTNIIDIMLFLRDEDDMKFDYLACLSGMDYKDNLGVVYHLYSLSHKHRATIKVEVPKDNPKVPSISKVWRTADWHEREAYDMFGVIFEGHENLIRILNPYDWEGYPLRKDYKQPEEYHGLRVPY